MNFIDTHTHLYVEQFESDYKAVIENAQKIGVHKFYLPAIDSTYTKKMKLLKSTFSNVIELMSGIHPTHINPETIEQEWSHFFTEINSGNYKAVGEIGVDLYWDKTHKDLQMMYFSKQIEIALNLDLPFVIHCRNAFDETFEVLESYRNQIKKGIFHCFSSTLEHAKKAIDLNLHLGIGGVVTFKNGKINTFLKEIDLQHIVLETDAPYLAPTPYRGKRNTPEYIPVIAQKLAEIYNIDIETIAEQTTQNAQFIFGKESI